MSSLLNPIPLVQEKLDIKMIINILMVVFELVLMGTPRKDWNEAFEDYNQELVHSAHLYLLVEYFGGLILALAEHCYYLYAIQYHHHDFSEVDRKWMVLVGCVVMVDFHNAVYAPRTMLCRLGVVDQQQLSELATDLADF